MLIKAEPFLAEALNLMRILNYYTARFRNVLKILTTRLLTHFFKRKISRYVFVNPSSQLSRWVNSNSSMSQPSQNVMPNKCHTVHLINRKCLFLPPKARLE